jgi:hypothetical protein
LKGLDNDFLRLFNLHIDRGAIFVVDHPVERPILASVDHNCLGTYRSVWTGNILNVLGFRIFGKEDNGLSFALVVATLPVGPDQRRVSPILEKFPTTTHIPRFRHNVFVLEEDVVVVEVSRDLASIKKLGRVDRATNNQPIHGFTTRSNPSFNKAPHDLARVFVEFFFQLIYPSPNHWNTIRLPKVPRVFVLVAMGGGIGKHLIGAKRPSIETVLSHNPTNLGKYLP